MQPVQVEHCGSFYSALDRLTSKSSQSTMQLMFNDSGNAACLFDSQQLECYCGPKVWSRTFSWSIISDLKMANAVGENGETKLKKGQGSDLFSITSVRFIPCTVDRQIASSSASSSLGSLLVVLTNNVQNITWLCHFPNLNDKRHYAGVYLHGLVSVSEWIPSCVTEDRGLTSPTGSEPPTMLLDTNNISMNIDVSTGLVSCPRSSEDCSGFLAIGFRQGLVGLVDSQSDSGVVGGNYHSEPVWAVAVEKSQFRSMISRRQSKHLDTSDMDEAAFTYLDASAVRWNEFQYKSVNGRVLNNLPALSVYVSALRFIPNSQTLVVGYSFGGWQLWSMRTLTLEFSLRHMSICAPVVQVAFQEPSDDPRYCCYIWIGWQSCKDSATGEEINAQAKLYQLHYKQRIEEPGPVPGEVTYNYQNLVGLSERLGTELFTTHTDCTRPQDQLLRIQPIRAGSNSSLMGASASDTAHLVTLMWSLSPGVLRVGLFDLDRWYHAQMPTQIRPDNSFFAVVDVPLPKESAIALHGHLLEHTMESFWSRVAARERQLDALCEPLPASNSQFKSLGQTPVSSAFTGAATTTVPRHLAPRPVPEVFLRPSALSFSIIVAWLTPKSSVGCGGGFLLARFASRQEVCFLSLATATSAVADKRFSPTDWLSEAWATGLLESPGLDVIEEEDLERLLHLSSELDSRIAEPNHPSSDIDLVGLRLAYGEGLDMSLVRAMEDILALSRDSSELDAPSSKRLCVSGTVSSSTGMPENIVSRTVLSPAWVLFTNCLLEHGHMAPLKSIEQLAKGCGPTSPANPQFRQYWLWLRFQRLKTRFDQLTVPLFSPVVDASTKDSRSMSALDKEDVLELGATACQIQQLDNLARHWFTDDQLADKSLRKKHPAAQSKTSPSLWSAISTYVSYTRLVLFLCRLGLLPQHTPRPDSTTEIALEDWLIDLDNTNKSLLLPYTPELINHAICELRERGGFDTEAPLTEALLHTCLGCLPNSSRSSNSDQLRVWYEQEGLDQADRSRLQPSYPPTRLQSLCALWQLGQCDSLQNRARLGLLGFVLCDATAATVSARRMPADDGHVDSNMLAVHLCRHVLSLYAKEFPSVHSLLPTIFTLWLLDRTCFKEVKVTPLRAYVTGSTRNPWESVQICSLFPNQSAILEDYMRRHKQSDLYHQLLSASIESQSVLDTIEKKSTSHKRTGRTGEIQMIDFRPTGAPFLSLVRFRRMAQEFYNLKDSRMPDEDLVERTEDALRNMFIRITEACRRAGRIGDLVNLGLTVWEAQTLVDFYLSTKQYDVLFYCLVARKQYKNALGIYDQYLKWRRTSSMLVGMPPVRSAPRSDSNLALVYKLIASALPEFQEDPRDQWSEFADRQRLVDALAHPFVALEPTAMQASPLEPVAYRRDSALTCPLTTAKSKGPGRLHNIKRDAAMFTIGDRHDDSDDDDHAREDVLGSVYSPVSRTSPHAERMRTDKLLETARKSSSEFWDTFRVLENIERTCNLSFNFSTLIKPSQLDSSSSMLSSRPSLAAGCADTSHWGASDRSGKARLFKLIYTPPTNRYRKRTDSAQSVPPHRPVISARRSCHTSHADNQTPISILKSSISRTPVADAASFGLIDQSLNETLACDDVKLNLSTVRPSLLTTSTLNAAPIVVAKEFTFSAPRRISVCSELASTGSSVLEGKPTFNFATPLRPHTKPAHSDEFDWITTDTARTDVRVSTTDAGSESTTLPCGVTPSVTDSSCENLDNSPILSPNRTITGKPFSPRKPLDACRAKTNIEDPQNVEQSSEPEHSICSTVIDKDHKRHLAVESVDVSTMDVDDMDDTASMTSIASQDNDTSSFSSETPRRSARRVKPPKRYDPSAFR